MHEFQMPGLHYSCLILNVLGLWFFLFLLFLTVFCFYAIVNEVFSFLCKCRWTFHPYKPRRLSHIEVSHTWRPYQPWHLPVVCPLMTSFTHLKSVHFSVLVFERYSFLSSLDVVLQPVFKSANIVRTSCDIMSIFLHVCWSHFMRTTS